MGEKAHRDDDVRAVAVAGDDFEALDGLGVADDVVEGARAVLRAGGGGAGTEVGRGARSARALWAAYAVRGEGVPSRPCVRMRVSLGRSMQREGARDDAERREEMRTRARTRTHQGSSKATGASSSLALPLAAELVDWNGSVADMAGGVVEGRRRRRRRSWLSSCRLVSLSCAESCCTRCYATLASTHYDSLTRASVRDSGKQGGWARETTRRRSCARQALCASLMMGSSSQSSARALPRWLVARAGRSPSLSTPLPLLAASSRARRPPSIRGSQMLRT